MSLDKSFDPGAVERRWYRRWEDAGWFAAGAEPGKPAFCIQLPPPNVTGVLHMGHAFNQTIMDALTRYHRMRGASTLWLVASQSPGLRVTAPFDGLGLRGNHSSPVLAEGVLVEPSARLGPDGGGFDIMMSIVLPYFQFMSAGCGVGMMEAATTKAAAHVGGTKLAHLGSALADLPTIRAYLARMRIKTDMVQALLLDALSAAETGRPDALLRILEVKAAAGEASTEVTDLAMRVCGGAAFRKEVGVERNFRDARAATVMAPTTDVLYDFIGKATCGLPLFG